MKKRCPMMVLIIALILTIGAQAIAPMRASGRPWLTFDGRTAECSASCVGDSDNDWVSATLELYQGSTFVDSWSGSGYGDVYVSGSCDVTRGRSYTLTVNYTVNGVEKPPVSVTATCPLFG